MRIFLRGTRLGCDEYGVVAADVADDLGPTATVERKGDTLGSANSGVYYQ